MTYIDYFNDFNQWLEANALPVSSQLMSFRLLNIFNRAGWPEDVGVDNLRLQIMLDGVFVHYKEGWEICDFSVSVDSGQAGVFDSAHYHDDSVSAGMPGPEHDFDTVWYNHCCDLTLGEQQAGVIPVSSSGLGDGCYTALQHKNEQGQVDGIVILFLPEEDTGL